MNLTVHQSINIHTFKVGSVANSSIIQIGSAGNVQAKSELYNTGGYTESAPEPELHDADVLDPVQLEGGITDPLVPLVPPT